MPATQFGPKGDLLLTAFAIFRLGFQDGIYKSRDLSCKKSSKCAFTPENEVQVDSETLLSHEHFASGISVKVSQHVQR